MKIEKGKLYYNHQLESVIIAVEDSNDKSGILSDKIAVHCPTKDDKLFVSNTYHLNTVLSNIEYIHKNKLDYILLETDYCIAPTCGIFESYHIITIDQFKEFYPEAPALKDPISPLHYTNKGIQPIDYIEANKLDFNEGNVIKYVTRYKDKNGLEDLKKAKFYIERLIDLNK